MTYGTFEAKLAETLSGFEQELDRRIKLAYLPSSGIIKLRLTAKGDDHEALTRSLDLQVSKLRDIIPDLIYSETEESLEQVTGRLLTDGKLTLSTAESCTGGTIAHLITSTPGSSAYYRGSVIAYGNSVKTGLLGVREATIGNNGSVSEEVVREMAEGARKLFRTDFSVATSGIAGPDGGTKTKPVGTLWMAVASESGTVAEKRIFGSDRTNNITRFSLAALNLLRQQIIRS